MPDPDGEGRGGRQSDRIHSPTISVIIPTYQEHESIGEVVRDVFSHTSGRACEIVIVDDSPDTRTWQAIRAAADDVDCQVNRIHRPYKSGLGSAVLDGFHRAHGDRLIVMDGDGQHPPGAVPELADALEDVDVAVGSRHAGRGRIRADWPLRRTAMSFGASAIAWAAVPDARRLQDPMSGFFAVRRSIVTPVQERLEPDGHKILLEILARCPVDDVVEVPIAFGDRGAGESTTDGREMVRFLWHMSKLTLASRRRRRPERVTVPVEVDS